MDAETIVFENLYIRLIKHFNGGVGLSVKKSHCFFCEHKDFSLQFSLTDYEFTIHELKGRHNLHRIRNEVLQIVTDVAKDEGLVISVIAPVGALCLRLFCLGYVFDECDESYILW